MSRSYLGNSEKQKLKHKFIKHNQDSHTLNYIGCDVSEQLRRIMYAHEMHILS